MKVKEFIEKLKKCNQEADIYVGDFESEIDLWVEGADGITLQNADKIYIDDAIPEDLEHI